MTYKTHLSTGLLFSSFVFLLIYKIELTPVLTLVLIFATVLGASAPDLDTPTGGLWRKIPAGGVISHIIKPVFIGGHRHITHSILGLAAFAGLFYLLIKIILFSFLIHNSYFLILAYAVGHASHIFADMFTEEGVPVLFPWDYHFGIPPNPLDKVRIKTGQWFENLVVYPLLNLALIAIITSTFLDDSLPVLWTFYCILAIY